MGKKDKPDRRKAHSTCCEKPCCQELLQDVMSGAVPADQYVERLLDHLERIA